MKRIASPVFTACISEFMLHETQPPRATALSGLELRLFIPDARETVEGTTPFEYTLQLDNKNLYDHFYLRGVADDTAENEQHNLCLLLLQVRDTLLSGLVGIINPGTGN
jgi:hypothetical protein